MPPRLGSVDPLRFPREIFDLYSIPAYDLGVPETLSGNEIGSSKQLVQRGDVLFSRIVPHIRRAWIVGETNGHRTIGSGEWIVLRSPDLLPDYLRHFLLTDDCNRKVMRTLAGVGGSLMRARPAGVAQILIPVPPLEEQKRIAAILDKADAIRRKREQAIQLADEFLRSLFLDMFGDPVRNPKGWPTKLLAQLCSKITDGEHLNPTFAEDGSPMVMAGDVTNFGVSFKSTRHVCFNDAERFRRKCNPEIGDLLVVSRGATIGRCCIVDTPIPFCLMGSVILLKPRRDHISESYLKALLSLPIYKQRLYNTSGSSAQQAIYLKDLARMFVPLPPLDQQKKFSDIACKCKASDRNVTRLAHELRVLTRAINKQAFAGSL